MFITAMVSKMVNSQPQALEQLLVQAEALSYDL